VHYRAELQSMHGFPCYDNIAPRVLAIGAHDSIAANAKCQRVHAGTCSMTSLTSVLALFGENKCRYLACKNQYHFPQTISFGTAGKRQ